MALWVTGDSCKNLTNIIVLPKRHKESHSVHSSGSDFLLRIKNTLEELQLVF